MKILAIETSCDETAAAFVENGTTVLSHVVASSSDLFKETGGIVPEVAARKQLEYIIPVIDKTLNNANLSIKNIDFLAVTAGPGLLGSLLVGVDCAKTLSFIYKKPIIPVNHLLGHIYSVFITDYLGEQVQNNVPKFPLITLVVSGGHTDLVLIKDFLDISYLGGTRDDAAGEAFDKAARILGVSKYLGGSVISKLAEYSKGNVNFKLPRPMLRSDDLDFSFSGLKTALLKEIEDPHVKTTTMLSDLCFEFEQAVVHVLVSKLQKAVDLYNPRSIAVVGGVSANKKLRATVLSTFSNYDVFIPPIYLCTDNAAMIGSAAFYLKNKYSDLIESQDLSKIKANPSLSLENLYNLD